MLSYCRTNPVLGRCASCAPAWLALGFLGLVTAPVGGRANGFA